MNNFNKRLKNLIESKFQGPKDYNKKQQEKWNNIMNKPTLIKGKYVWSTPKEATKKVNNNSKSSNKESQNKNQ